MGSKSRSKGYGYEREIAHELKEFFPEAKRHLEFQESDAKGFDLDNTGKYRIQCKRYKSYAPIAKIEEVHKESGSVPVLMTRGDNKPTVVCMYLEDFKDLLREARADDNFKSAQLFEKVKMIIVDNMGER